MSKKIFRQFLEERGQRLTKERDAVMRRVFARKGHFDPETLYMDMKRGGMKASRASVYRTLNLLYECGLLEKVSKTEHGTVYEQAVGRSHHDHMVCLRCGNVIEFYSEALEKLQEDICRERGFTGTAHTLEIRGYCAQCETKEEGSKGEHQHG